MTKGLGRLRTVAVWVLGSIVNMAMVVSFTESYRGLYLWATGHKVDGIFAYSWPIMIDAFSLAGEIVLLTSAIGAWPKKTRLLGWTMSLGGLAASIIANSGHVGAHATTADHVTAAVPPVAAMASMVAAISIIKQMVQTAEAVTETPDTPQAAPMLLGEYADPYDAEIRALNELPSHAAKVRAAVSVLTLYATPAEIYQWLTDRDQDVPITSINVTLSRERAKGREGQDDAESLTAEPVDASIHSGQIPAGQRRLSRV